MLHCLQPSSHSSAETLFVSLHNAGICPAFGVLAVGRVSAGLAGNVPAAVVVTVTANVGGLYDMPATLSMMINLADCYWSARKSHRCPTEFTDIHKPLKMHGETQEVVLPLCFESNVTD